MNKKKLGGFLGALAGIAAAIIAAKQPHHAQPPPPPPSDVPTYTLTVHVCRGSCDLDHKLTAAPVRIDDGAIAALTDGAGNVSFEHVAAGVYKVCAEAAGYASFCAEQHRVPADGEVYLGLDPLQAPLSPLHADGHIFRTADGTPFRWKGVSAFQLLDRFAKGEDLTPFLDAYKGYNLLRAWPYVPTADWGTKAWDTPDTDTIRRFLAAMNGQGWYVELTLLTDDDPARLAWAKALVPQLTAGGCPAGLLLEGGNEPLTHKAIDTPALRGVLAASGCLYASGDYEDSARAYGSYLVAHTSRDSEWPRRAHDALEYYNGGGPNSPSDPAHRVPVVLDEPAKLQDVGGDRVKDWRAYFGAGSLLAGGLTFHSETGKYAQPPTGDERALIAAALEGLNAFPADAPNGPYSRPDDASLRTYIVGPFMCRIRPTGPGPSGWTAIDGDGILWRR